MGLILLVGIISDLPNQVAVSTGPTVHIQPSQQPFQYTQQTPRLVQTPLIQYFPDSKCLGGGGIAGAPPYLSPYPEVHGSTFIVSMLLFVSPCVHIYVCMLQICWLLLPRHPQAMRRSRSREKMQERGVRGRNTGTITITTSTRRNIR